MILPIEYHGTPRSKGGDENVKSILVIDDDVGLRKALSIFLKLQYDVFSAAGVDEGIAIYEECGADLVIIDYQMPRKDGFKGIREFRARDRNLPIILLTAYGDEDTFKVASALGADDCMSKPFELDEVFRSLDERFSTPPPPKAA
ncbi:MAG: response regulator [Verrucomicrobiales bacterium]